MTVTVRAILLVTCFLLFSFAPSQSNAAEEKADPAKVKVGFFVTSLHDFSLTKNEYDIISWVWLLSQNEEYKPFESTEIINAKSFSLDSNTMDKVTDTFWHSMKIHARMKHDWDITNYPFDVQRLEVQLEDMILEAAELQYVPDRENTKIDPDLLLTGWNVLGVDVEVADKVYHTSYGDPSAEQDEWNYSRANLVITLQRQGERLLVDSLIGTYVAFILALLVFAVPTTAMPGKFAFLTGAIFAAIGNKYIIDSKLPASVALTLTDRIQWLTFGCIAVSALAAILVGHSVKKPWEQKMMRVNYGIQIGMLILYISLNAYWISRVVL